MGFGHYIVILEVALLVGATAVGLFFTVLALLFNRKGRVWYVLRKIRWAALLLCLFGSYKGLSTGVADIRRYCQFAEQGVEAQAEVFYVGKYVAARGKRKTWYQNFVRYQDESGKWHRVCFVERSRYKIGENIEVCYTRSAPHAAVRKTAELTSPLFASIGVIAGGCSVGLSMVFISAILFSRK